MIELLQYPFFIRALITGLVISILCGLLSVFVILRRMAFIGAGISHAAFGGVAIGFFFGISPTLTAVVYAVLTAIFISKVLEKRKVTEDAAIGIFFSSSMAVGVIFVGLSKNYSVDLFGYLFGNILAVQNEEVFIMMLMTIIILSYYFFNFRKLYIMSFNEELAYLLGVNTKKQSLLLMVILSLLIVLSMKVVGLILVSALLVIPAVTARLLSNRISIIIILSVIIAAVCSLAGLFLSYYLDISSGGAIVMLLTLIFLIIWGHRKIL